MISRRILTLAALAMPAVARAQAWPNRPIRVIIPFPPGGATDAMSRLAAQKIGEKLGVNVIPENRVGGNGTVGGMALAQAAPDGHTLLASASIQVMLKHVLKNVPFDPVTDMQPIARTARGPLMLVITPGLAPKTIPEVVAAAKAQPDKWSIAVSSLGAAGHLASIAFNKATGSDILIVPYRGSAPGLTDVAAGNAQLMFDPILAPLPMVRGGQLRALAVTSEERMPVAPDVPTAQEAGLPGFTFYSWYGVWGPRGLPAEIVARINAALAEGMQEPDVVSRIMQLGFQPVAESADAFGRYIQQDVAQNAELLRLANFQPE